MPNFTYTGSEQKYVVPADVDRVEVELWGASGGAPNLADRGVGGYLRGVMAVQPGSTLHVFPGEAGKLTFGGDGFGKADGGDGGSNTGANPWGGGAGSFILLEATDPIHKALAVAGGGGGSSRSVHIVDSTTQYFVWRGGHGGGASGGDGYPYLSLLAGHGASGDQPGAGGSPAGQPGVDGNGGGSTAVAFGGGGGGGFGGGGAGGGKVDGQNVDSGSGGGGSGGFPAACTGIRVINVQYGHASYNTTRNPNLFTSGDGYIIITPAPSCQAAVDPCQNVHRPTNVGNVRVIQQFRSFNREARQ